MLGYLRKIHWGFVLLYFLPLCLVYWATLNNNFAISTPLNTLILRSRGLFILLVTGVGWMMMGNKPISSSVKKALILSCYMLFVTVFSDGKINIATLAIVLFWSITFYISEKSVVNSEDIGVLAFIAAVVCNFMAWDVIRYYPMLSFMGHLEHEQMVAASNSIYYVMSSCIFIFLIKNNIVKILLMLMPCMAFLIVGKSTCLLAVSVSILYYIRHMIINSKNRFWIIAFLVISILVAINFSSGLIDIEETLLGFGEDVDSGGNGRKEIWMSVLRKFSTSDVGQILMGHGSQGVSKAISLGGHNDFIEVLYDFGLVGLFLYFAFWWSLLRRSTDYKKGTDMQSAYIVSLIVYAAASMFSNFINAQIEMLFFVMFWGITYVQKTRTK